MGKYGFYFFIRPGKITVCRNQYCPIEFVLKGIISVAILTSVIFSLGT